MVESAQFFTPFLRRIINAAPLAHIVKITRTNYAVAVQK